MDVKFKQAGESIKKNAQLLVPRECYLQWINFYRRLRSIFRGIILMFVNIGRKFIYLVEIFFLTKWNIINESLSFDIIFFAQFMTAREK